MWIVEKKVGIFTHYLSPSGKFEPGKEKAKYFNSKQMAEAMVRVHGGMVREINENE